MISTSGADRGADPTLAALVPRRSPWRNAGSLLVAVLTLAGVAWYGSEGRPSMSSDGGSSSVLSGEQVLIDARSTARGFPAPTLESVTAPPGTSVVGVWVLDSDDPLLRLLDGTSAGLDATRDALLSGARSARALPQPLPTAGEFELVLLVDIVDCSALPADPGVPRTPAAARLRSCLGSTSSSPLGVIDGPLDRQFLTSEGACPAG